MVSSRNRDPLLLSLPLPLALTLSLHADADAIPAADVVPVPALPGEEVITDGWSSESGDTT